MEFWSRKTEVAFSCKTYINNNKNLQLWKYMYFTMYIGILTDCTHYWNFFWNSQEDYCGIFMKREVSIMSLVNNWYLGESIEKFKSFHLGFAIPEGMKKTEVDLEVVQTHYCVILSDWWDMAQGEKVSPSGGGACKGCCSAPVPTSLAFSSYLDEDKWTHSSF